MNIVLLLVILLLAAAGVQSNCRKIKKRSRCDANKFPKCTWVGDRCTHELCLMGAHAEMSHEFCFNNCQKAVYDCRCEKCYSFTRSKDCRALSACCLWQFGKCQSHFKDTTPS